MTTPQDQTPQDQTPPGPPPEYHPFPEHDWVPPEPPRYRRWPRIALTGVCAAAVVTGVVAVATHESAPATVGNHLAAPASLATKLTPTGNSGSAAVPTSPAAVAPSSDPVAPSVSELAPSADLTAPASDPAAVAQSFAEKIAQGESDSATLAVPGSMAHLYADGVALLFQGDPSLYKAVAVPAPGNGWDIGGGIILSDFVVTPEGLIQAFSRNGISVDRLVAPGDGTTYTATPTTGQDTWSGQLQAKIHSFRFLDGRLQVLVTNENQTSAQAGLTFQTYTVNGEQSRGTCCDLASPGVTKTSLSEFPNVPSGGGTAAARLTVDQSGMADAVEIEVPTLG